MSQEVAYSLRSIPEARRAYRAAAARRTILRTVPARSASVQHPVKDTTQYPELLDRSSRLMRGLRILMRVIRSTLAFILSIAACGCGGEGGSGGTPSGTRTHTPTVTPATPVPTPTPAPKVTDVDLPVTDMVYDPLSDRIY